MPWKQGKVTLDDGSTYKADFLINENNQVLNMKVYKDGKVFKEIDAGAFAGKLGKEADEVYPYKIEIEG